MAPNCITLQFSTYSSILYCTEVSKETPDYFFLFPSSISEDSKRWDWVEFAPLNSGLPRVVVLKHLSPGPTF